MRALQLATVAVPAGRSLAYGAGAAHPTAGGSSECRAMRSTTPLSWPPSARRATARSWPP